MDWPDLKGDCVIVPPGGWHQDAPASWREGARFIPYPTIEDARADAEASVVVYTEGAEDFVLMTCPLGFVKADEPTLHLLSRDLVFLAVEEGIMLDEKYSPDAPWDTYFVRLPKDARIKSPERPGRVVDGVWMNHRLEHEMLLRPMVEDVVFGRSQRLNIPDHYPLDLAPSLDAIRPFPTARVTLSLGANGHPTTVIDAAVSIVWAPEQSLRTLLNDIDTAYQANPRYRKRCDCPPKPNTIYFHRYTPRLDRREVDLYLFPEKALLEREEHIRQVLMGKRDRL